jgi:crotonobetainyl-CoA:carnitine CoA-transferase CaiB-like acyl-CoA transferase
MTLLGLGERSDLRTSAGRAAAREDIDAAMADFCASRSLDEVIAAFEEANAAAAPVYDMADVHSDPHVRERGMITEVDGIPMQGLLAWLSATPGAIRWAGRGLGVDAPRWDGAPLP